MDCSCKMYGNQYGSWYLFCQHHYAKFLMAATMLGLTLEEFVENAVEEWFSRRDPDRRRWLY